MTAWSITIPAQSPLPARGGIGLQEGSLRDGRDDSHPLQPRARLEAKEVEHSTVSLLLKFIVPGSIEIMPLFDRMEEADDEKHGDHSDDWRKEPIAALKLSAAALRALIDADIVLVGQLQDRLLKDGSHWADDLVLSARKSLLIRRWWEAKGVANAVLDLNDFIDRFDTCELGGV